MHFYSKVELDSSCVEIHAQMSASKLFLFHRPQLSIKNKLMHIGLSVWFYKSIDIFLNDNLIG